MDSSNLKSTWRRVRTLLPRQSPTTALHSHFCIDLRGASRRSSWTIWFELQTKAAMYKVVICQGDVATN